MKSWTAYILLFTILLIPIFNKYEIHDFWMMLSLSMILATFAELLYSILKELEKINEKWQS